MLFYTQIKKEFTNASWKRGQVYFRQERVTDVKQDGDHVSAKVQGSEPDAYETGISMARGSIFSSKCSCPAHRQYETHCKHVAALAIWIVERGSLLRAGVRSGSYGIAPKENEVAFRNPQRAADDPRLRKLLLSHPFLATSAFVIRRDLMAGSIQGKDQSGNPYSIPITLVEATALLQHVTTPTKEEKISEAILGEPVLFVRGMFQSKVFSALTVESAIRYVDPGVLLQVGTEAQAEDQDASFILRLETNKIIYQGQSALENLGKLLTHKQRHLMVFDRGVNVAIEPEPLRLVSLSLGRKAEKSRSLGFEFAGGGSRFNAQQLEELAKLGRLSNHYVWSEDKIFKLGISMLQLSQYANRTGVASSESGEHPKVGGFTSVHDDSENPLHPIAAFRLSLELGVENFNVDPDWVEFHEWKKIFSKTRVPALPKVPYGFDLREYQDNGLTWLWSLYHRGLAALLADEMGLGKTHQVLALLTSLYQGKKNSAKQPSLVVAPTSVITAWIQKLKRYDTGLKWHVFHGSGRTLPVSGVDLVLTTYGILHREPILRERDWHIVILDEAQMIKNASTISSRASRTLKSKFRIAMTGTPVENQAADLWSIMEFLLPGYLGTLPRFKRIYGWGRETPPEAQAAALRRLISPFLLRRTKAQVLKELPEKTEEVVECELTPVQRKTYRAFLDGEDATRIRENLESNGKVDYANILALLTRLKQVCDHPRLSELTSGKVKHARALNPADTGKWEAFEELLNEALGSNLKIVVFTQYLGMIELIGNYLKTHKVGYTELKGDTPDRGARLDKFANEPDCRVFLCSLLAGGLGIDLTSASVCIHFDRWWNPAKENQATDRLHRLGQTRGVQVFKLQIPGTVEERIAAIIASKMELSGALIEESSLGLKAFSKKELLKILSPEGI